MTGKRKIPESLTSLAAWLAKPHVVFFALPFLMILLTCGTIGQRYIGLYDAQKTFFSSFILWLGPVPAPGGYTLIAAIGLSLLVKFLFFSAWTLKKAGINITHLGVLILLGGGLLTALHAEEGYAVIPEGGRTSMVADYHERALAIAADDALLAVVPHRKIRQGAVFRIDGLPFAVTVRDACRNCRIDKREESQEHFDAPLRGMARFMALSPQKPAKEDEENLYGATLSIAGAGGDFDGIYVVFEAMPKPIRIEKDGHRYDILYSRRQRALPFALRLENFEKTVYPGTDMPSGYSSDLIVEEEGSSWPARIEMNKPLRYKGYTFFQSSFAEKGDETASVLAVVRNSGWFFPYLGVAVITAGLLFHLAVAGFTGRKRT